MKLKNVEEFRDFCKAVDENNCFDFNEEAFVMEGREVRYKTTHRDEDNYKAGLSLTWYPATGIVEFDCGHPEAADEIANVYQGFLKPEDRKFTVYLKLEVRAMNENRAIEKAEDAIKGHKGISGHVFSNARTAQFG